MPQEVQKLLCDVLVEIETTGHGRREREICGELWVCRCKFRGGRRRRSLAECSGDAGISNPGMLRWEISVAHFC